MDNDEANFSDLFDDQHASCEICGRLGCIEPRCVMTEECVHRKPLTVSHGLHVHTGVCLQEWEASLKEGETFAASLAMAVKS